MIFTVLFCVFSFTSAGGAYLMDTSVTDSSGVNWWTHDINRIEMCFNNTGYLTLTSYGNDGCWWPKGTGQDYFEGIGIWFGTVDQETGDTLVSTAFGRYLQCFEFKPGLSGQDPKSEITHIYKYPDRWPPNHDSYPTAPVKAISHQDSWCVFNDSAQECHDTRPIGVEIYQTIFAWNYTLTQDMIYMIFEVRNVSGRSLLGNYLGLFILADIGNGSSTSNDIAVAIPSRWFEFADSDSVRVDDFGYVWQAGGETGWNPPVPAAVGFDLVQTPFNLVSGQDKDADGIPDQCERDSAFYHQSVPRSKWDADFDYIPDWRDASQNPQDGMSAFKRFNLLYRPDRDPERYLAMAGYNFNTGAYEPFDTIPPCPDYMTFMMSSGPFDLMPDSSAVAAYGMMFVKWDDIYEIPDTALAMFDQYVQRIWDELYFEPGVSRLPPTVYDSIVFVVSPNPSNNRASAALTLPESRDVELGLFDVCGRKVLDLYHGSLDPGRNELTFAVREYPQGTYFLVMKTADKQYTRRLVVVK